MQKLLMAGAAALLLGAAPVMALADDAAQSAASSAKADANAAKQANKHAQSAAHNAGHHAKKAISDTAQSQQKAVDQTVTGH
jgi:hypothetical protein